MVVEEEGVTFINNNNWSKRAKKKNNNIENTWERRISKCICIGMKRNSSINQARIKQAHYRT